MVMVLLVGDEVGADDGPPVGPHVNEVEGAADRIGKPVGIGKPVDDAVGDGVTEVELSSPPPREYRSKAHCPPGVDTAVQQ